jgi:hypothetical protein
MFHKSHSITEKSMAPLVGDFKIDIVTYMDSTTNSKKKSHITFFFECLHFAPDHFEFFVFFVTKKWSNLQSKFQ